ncbi:MAG: hypothetical protein ACRD5G_11620 [Candidatus Acidiferrales bacterium]
MSIAIVGTIGAAAGAAIAIALYLLSPYLVEPRDETKENQERVTFLLEASKPLKQMALVIDLRQPLAPDALRHFRALVTIANLDVSARFADASNLDNPHPTLCVGGRDHYPVAHSGGMQRKWFGVQNRVYALNPNEEMQNMLFSMGQAVSSRVELGGGLYGKGPFKTISDLDDRSVDVYVTEPLMRHIAAIHLVANNYVLFSEVATNLAVVNGGPLFGKWPDPLAPEEEAIRWIMLLPRGADYERFMKERTELGHDPAWFPANLYRTWVLSFDEHTPRRIG